MSFSVDLLNPQIRIGFPILSLPSINGPICCAMAFTASKSPGDAIGKPASQTSTPNLLKTLAISSFSFKLRVAPGDCSPSRRVVSENHQKTEPSKQMTYLPNMIKRSCPATALELIERTDPRSPRRKPPIILLFTGYFLSTNHVQCLHNIHPR